MLVFYMSEVLFLDMVRFATSRMLTRVLRLLGSDFLQPLLLLAFKIKCGARFVVPVNLKCFPKLQVLFFLELRLEMGVFALDLELSLFEFFFEHFLGLFNSLLNLLGIEFFFL